MKYCNIYLSLQGALRDFGAYCRARIREFLRLSLLLWTKSSPLWGGKVGARFIVSFKNLIFFVSGIFFGLVKIDAELRDILKAMQEQDDINDSVNTVLKTLDSFFTTD